MTTDEIKSLRLDAQMAMDNYAEAIRNHQIAVSLLAKRTDEMQRLMDKLLNAVKGGPDAR